MDKELAAKNKQIEKVGEQKKELERSELKVAEFGIEIGEHQEEIELLDERYKQALKNKAQVYEELVHCVKELMTRNSNFL